MKKLFFGIIEDGDLLQRRNVKDAVEIDNSNWLFYWVSKERDFENDKLIYILDRKKVIEDIDLTIYGYQQTIKHNGLALFNRRKRELNKIYKIEIKELIELKNKIKNCWKIAVFYWQEEE